MSRTGGLSLNWDVAARGGPPWLSSVGALLLLGPNPVVRAQSGTTGTPGPAASVVAKIRELNTTNEEIRQVAFGPNGAAVILHGTNAATWIQVPQTLADKVNELIGAGNQVRHDEADRLHHRRRLDHPLRTQRCVLGRDPLRASRPTPEASPSDG